MQDLQQTYTAAMDSVNLLNAGKPADTTDEDWADTVKRNVDHLEIVVAKEWTEDFDLTPFNDAIAANS
jgi:hypothetical protein